MSKTNLKRALSIERNLTDSMKELLDDGVVSKTLASDVITSLSENDVSQNGKTGDWGEPESLIDFSVEEILDMPTVSEVQSEPCNPVEKLPWGTDCTKVDSQTVYGN